MSTNVALYKTALDALDFTYTQCRKQVELLRSGAGDVTVLAALLDRTIPTSPADCALAALVQHLTDRRNAVSNLFKDRLACLLLLADPSLVSTALCANDVISVELSSGHYTVKQIGATAQPSGQPAATPRPPAPPYQPRGPTYPSRGTPRGARTTRVTSARGHPRNATAGAPPRQPTIYPRPTSIGLSREAMDAILASASSKMNEVEEFPLPTRAQKNASQVAEQATASATATTASAAAASAAAASAAAPATAPATAAAASATAPVQTKTPRADWNDDGDMDYSTQPPV